MHLTCILKLRTNDHDRRRLRVALARWAAALNEAVDRARTRQQDLLRCIVLWRSADGNRQRLVLDKERLRRIIRECLKALSTHLHASARASLVVALDELLGSWLGLYIDWLNHNRATPKPRLPALPCPTPRVAQDRFVMALDMSPGIVTAAEEKGWRTAINRSGSSRQVPMWFGAVTSGGEPGLNYCGLLRREDGRYFALLTLWPLQDALGGPITRSRNRLHTGEIRNVRARIAFSPTPRARSSMLLPLEMGNGQEKLFFGRAEPRSAQLVQKGHEYFLHVTFDFPDHPPVALSGNILAVRSGVNTLLTVLVMNPKGQVEHRQSIGGRDLVEAIREIRSDRTVQMRRGRPLSGDRRLGRVAKHHLYRAGHEVIDLARRFAAEIVLLEDRAARRPRRFIAFRHQSRLREILAQLSAEAGLPPLEERKVYGSWKTCVQCGWMPGESVRHEDAEADQCPGCAARHDPDYHLTHLLALDTLRLRCPAEQRPPLGGFIRTLRSTREGA